MLRTTIDYSFSGSMLFNSRYVIFNFLYFILKCTEISVCIKKSKLKKKHIEVFVFSAMYLYSSTKKIYFYVIHVVVSQ